MSSSIVAGALRREIRGREVRCGLYRPPLVGLPRLTMVVLALGLLSVQPKPLRADDHPPAEAASAPSGFVAEHRGVLKRLQEQLASLGARALEGLDMSDPTADDVAGQSTIVESAEAGHQQAVLAREAAEIALKEYKEGLFKQEKKVRETEVELAQGELESADRAITPAKERYAKIKQVSTGSVLDLAAEWQFETGEYAAQLKQKSAQFALEQAKSKQKMLLEYENPKRVKELSSDFHKMRSAELARRATWGLEQSKLKKLQNPARSQGPVTEGRKRILTLLDSAIPLEEQLSAELDQHKPDIPPSDAAKKEISDLARKLREIFDHAQDEQNAADLARLKTRIRRTVDQ
jgi:hypothetical protein